MFLALSMLGASCSSQTMVKLDEAGPGGVITARIAISPFFVEYLRDLIGFDAFSDIIDLTTLKEFFESQPQTDYTYTSVSNDPEFIVVHIATKDIPTLLSGLDIPFEIKQRAGNITNIQVKITKELIKKIISDMPVFKKIGTESLFIFDNDAVEQKQFAEYMGWALSDYGDKDSIEKTVENSAVELLMEKQNLNAPFPDKRWKKEKDFIQKRILFLTDILYEDTYNISYTF